MRLRGWLRPGMGVKRWLLLVLVAEAGLALAVGGWKIIALGGTWYFALLAVGFLLTGGLLLLAPPKIYRPSTCW